MANEYIRKQDAIASLPQQISIQNPHMKGYVKGYNGCKFDAERAIKNLEPADVVQVVRCKDCYLSYPEHNYHCTMWGCSRSKDGFCDLGKRREE